MSQSDCMVVLQNDWTMFGFGVTEK